MRWLTLGLVVSAVACGGKSSSDAEKKQPIADEPRPDPDAIPGVELPEVDAVGYLPTSTKAPLLRVTPKAIFVEGLEVVRLVDGKIDAADREGGRADGYKIPKLTQMLGTLGGGKGGVMPRPPLVLALDRTSTFKTMVDVMFSAKQTEAGWKHFSFLATSGGKLVALPIALPDKRAATTAGRISVAGAPPVSPSASAGLTPDQVSRKIQTAYLAAVKRCYKTALARDPSLRGKVTLSFKVDPSGRTQDGKANGFSPDVDRCIADLMPSWTFPTPASDTSFSIPLQFVPDDDSAAAPAARRPSTPSDDEAARLAERLTGGDGKVDDSSSMGKRVRDNPLYVDLEDDAEPVLGMVVSVNDSQILVWSFSGREGTLSAPALAVPRDDAASVGKVRDLLAAIAKKHYAGKPRGPATKVVVFTGRGGTPITLVAKLLGAMRGGTGDAEAFPEVQLSPGFE